MNVDLIQDGRMGALTTELGPDVLSLLRMTAEEHVNDLFMFRVEALSTEKNIILDRLIGTHATVMLKTFENPDVAFDGIVTEAIFVGMEENGWRYDLILRPWFWLASRRRNQRIFHDMSVVDILDELLSPYSGLGNPAVENRLSGSYPTLEYTVQYRESDMHFAMRLMERFGITYHFAHEMGSHTLVMTDAVTDHPPVHGLTRKFQMVDDNHRGDEEHFWELCPERRLTTGGIRLTDYNFKTPTAAMETDRMGDAQYAEGEIESFDYPGDYLDEPRGKEVVGLRMMQERGQDHRHRVVGDATSLRAGMTVLIDGDEVEGINEPSLCLSAVHMYSTNSYATGHGDSGPTYSGSQVLTPISTPLAPERKTRIPVVHGPQTAVVVGEGEIDCDEYGRIKVLFHWDLEQSISMRCRVSQNWAGKGWGGMVIPRIGMEVVVEFLEGDPNKPLVTGCVYNGKNDVPYKLPEHKTRSTFKSDTHKGKGFNEIRFEDEKDKEEIYVHGEKDRNTKIENNQSERVNVNKIESVGHDKASEVENNLLQAVGGSMDLRVGPGNIGSVAPAGAKSSPEGLPTIPERYGKAGSNPGVGDLNMAIERNKVQTVGEDHNEDVGKDKTTKVKKAYRLDAGTEIEIVAGNKITLTAGQSQIVMQDNGTITVNGKTINMTSDKLVKILSDMVKVN